MSARSQMTMRCSLERDGNAGIADERAWGAYLADVPCYVWADSAAERDAQARVVTIEDWRAIVPRDTDVTVDDRLASVTTRRGQPVRATPLNIAGVLPRPDHLELVLRETNP